MVLLRILLELVQVPLSILLTGRLSTAQAIADFKAAPAPARSRLWPLAEVLVILAAVGRLAEEDSMAEGVVNQYVEEGCLDIQ